MSFHKLSDFVGHDPSFDPMVKKLNEMVRALNSILPIIGSGDITVSQVGGAGTVIASLPRTYPRVNGLVVAQLTSDGGTGGGPNTAATFTYTCKSLDGTITYGTKMVPAMQRDTWVVVAAKIGFMLQTTYSVGSQTANASGWVLVWCDEVSNTSSSC